MSEAEGEPPRHFSFAFAETDLWAYRLLLAARRPRSSGAGFFFGAILSPIGAGLCVLAAFKLGLFPRAAFGPVCDLDRLRGWRRRLSRDLARPAAPRRAFGLRGLTQRQRTTELYIR